MRTARFLEGEREDRNVPGGIRAEEEEKDENGVALVQRVKERTGSFDIYLFNLYFEREKNEKIKSQLWTSIASIPCLRIFYYYYYLRKRISSFCSFLFF